MNDPNVDILDFSHWWTWISLACGVGVGWLVFAASGRLFFRRQPVGGGVMDEEIPWKALLDQLKEYCSNPSDARELAGLSPEDLKQALGGNYPGRLAGGGAAVLDDLRFAPRADRRSHHRRWLNPTNVTFFAPNQTQPAHGIVINRSEGGLAMLADSTFAEDTVLFVRVQQAPAGVPAIRVRVRHCRRAGPLWLVGCQFCEELPWNVKVWFG